MLELRFSKMLANLHIVGDGAHFGVADRLKLLVCYDEELGQLKCETYSKKTPLADSAYLLHKLKQISKITIERYSYSEISYSSSEYQYILLD